MKTLEEKFSKGDRKAFDTVYENYSRAMYAICLRYAKDAEASQDILQDAFVKIYKHRKKYDPKYPLAAWIKRIVINEAINHYKHELRFVATETNLLEQPEEITLTIDGDALKSKLKEAMQSLSIGCKTIFNLYTFENLTHKEIAEYLEISESTSKSQYIKAKKLIRAYLNKLGVTQEDFVYGEKI